MAPRWPQDGPKMAQDGPRMAPEWPQEGPGIIEGGAAGVQVGVPPPRDPPGAGPIDMIYKDCKTRIEERI